MKISQITYSGFGGLGSVVFSLIGADKVEAHEWSIGFVGDQPLDSSYPARCESRKVRYGAFQSTPGRPYRAWMRLANWLDEVRPDAIICHSINSVLACSWHATKRGVPLIVVEHTSNQVKGRTEWAASRVSMVVADKVVALTDEYKVELKEAHGWLYRPRKVSVIPNGIDTQVFRPADTWVLQLGRTIRLGMAARFSFSKRQDLLVDCLALLAQRRPELRFELSFAGDGSELERVQLAARTSAVAERIRFDGLLSEVEIAPWLRELDIYVHATDGETLSTSLLQAMATGLPIVASDIPGVSNLLKSKGNFGICVANEVDAFVTGILAYVDDRDAAASSGRRARQRIEEDYSCDTMLRRYLNAIEDAGSRQ